MSIIFQVKCRSCKYAEVFLDRLMIAVDDEGLEHNCVHPLESLTIERIEKDTGKSREVLRKIGQIYIGQPLLCNSCGEISYYSDAIINTLNLHHNDSHITEVNCKQCNKNNLYLPFPSSVPPKSLFPYINHDGRDSSNLLSWILLSLKLLVYILFVMLIVISLNLPLIFSIILSIFIMLAIPFLYIFSIADIIDNSPEKKYWKTIPCPQCQKLKLRFSFRGVS